ncbi:calcium sensing receptor, chloroplastic isoform X2 [Prosopis cineraria]|uniref:calcium sensing receptor, chloroplastic isoform X2 n=1 Tax=Prosopis cineraria TaxID=364024 RepID=UPI00240F979D|nr:calcium sensing receptor, chloroplastic isoform X2 [Prosopis cineraria]
MRMLPVCSVTPRYSLSSQIPLYGGSVYPLQKDLEGRCIMDDVHLGLQNGTHSVRNPFIAQATKSVCCSIANGAEQSVYAEFPGRFSSLNEPGHLECKFTNTWNYSPVTASGHHSLTCGELIYVENYDTSSVPERLMDLTEQSTEGSETLFSTDIVSEKLTPMPESIIVDNESLGSTKASIGDMFSGISKSFDASISEGENAFQSSLDTATSLMRSVIDNVTKSVDNAFGGALSSVNQTGELANKKLARFSSDISGITSKAPAFAIDVFRSTIIAVESSLVSVASHVVYLYGSAKELLPVGIRDAVNVYESKASQILRPIGSASREIFTTVYSLEKSLGLDPNDPIVPFVVVVGSSAAIWAVYRLWAYGGYSGDLSPKSALDLLSGNENASLIDIRNEDLREKDGIPDLRRAARFRYASITPLEVDSSVRKLFKSERDLNDSMIAVVIRNLKIVKDSSKVIVLDFDGGRSKGVARSLRKIGVKNPYLVQGGFQSWVKQGLRVKELKPETTLTLLNEEAEAILEDLRPSPLQILGYGMAVIAGLYALLDNLSEGDII